MPCHVESVTYPHITCNIVPDLVVSIRQRICLCQKCYYWRWIVAWGGEMKWCGSMVVLRRWIKGIVRREVVLGQLDKETWDFRAPDQGLKLRCVEKSGFFFFF